MLSTNFNKGWQLTLNGKTEDVTLPHDFMLGTDRTPNSPTGPNYGFFQPCKGVYTCKLEKDPSASKHLLKFDGVMGVCEVYVNNNRVTFHPYGYTGFTSDIGRYLNDGENDIRIEVDATGQPASRWYTGAGIYRDVELLTSDSDYIQPWGVKIAVDKIDDNDAYITVDVDVFASTHGEAEICLNVPEINHTTSRRTWLEEGDNHFSFKTILRNIERWTLESPVLYSAEVTLKTETSLDKEPVTIGIRELAWDSKKGLLLNGESVKLYGTCNHHDNGIVGAASFRSAEERRVRILKENGFNAIRCAHNPASTMLLDVCDRMGMLVIDEIFDCWASGKTAYDYHLWFNKYAEEDITAMVKRDRNHPCVIMWSTGNEIYERGGKNNGYYLGKMIADTIRKHDKTRPVTHAFCYFWDNWEYSKKMDETADYPADKLDFWCEKINPQAGNLDILGYNYLTHRVEKDIHRFPEHLFAITESYPLDAVWVKREMDKYPQLIGEFVWTGWDYFGETGIGHITLGVDSTPGWGLAQHPNHIANCGDFDICGVKKAPSYYRDAAWYNGSVHILTRDPDRFDVKYSISSWGFYDVDRTWTYTGKEGKKSTVHLYTAAPECELFQDGVSLGKKTPNYKGVAEFEVEYKPGKLEACAYENGLIVGKDELFTVGAATQLAIEADLTGESGKADLIYAEITLRDENSNVAWEANDEITVTVKGGKVLGTGTGKVDNEHNYTTNACEAYHGRILAAIVPLEDEVEIFASTDKLSAECKVCLN